MFVSAMENQRSVPRWSGFSLSPPSEKLIPHPAGEPWGTSNPPSSPGDKHGWINNST